jgi:Epoxide hydrolase N terminus
VRQYGTKREARALILTVSGRNSVTTKPQAFVLKVADEAIADLHDRLSRTHLPDQAPDPVWTFGCDVEYLRRLLAYWQSEFVWRAQEAALNALPQFRAPLHGIDLHFLHVPGEGVAPMPLLLSHGWPGSVFEFIDLIPRLTHPSLFGGRQLTPLLWSRHRYQATVYPSAQDKNVSASKQLPIASRT